jgi:hypothetical protein
VAGQTQWALTCNPSIVGVDGDSLVWGDNPMRTRRVVALILLVLLLAAGTTAFLLTSTFLSAMAFGMGKGDPRYAVHWRDRLSALSDPDSAKAAYSSIQSKRFPNGEWVFGVSSDSHDSHWGGTIVVKDSTGQIHAYFGHVCGPNRLEYILSTAESLREFYGHHDFETFHLREFDFPNPPPESR